MRHLIQSTTILFMVTLLACQWDLDEIEIPEEGHNNMETPYDLQVIRDFLRGNQVLETLELGQNSLQMVESVRMLVQGIRACPTLRNVNLHDLDDEGFQLMMDCLFEDAIQTLESFRSLYPKSMP